MIRKVAAMVIIIALCVTNIIALAPPSTTSEVYIPSESVETETIEIIPTEEESSTIILDGNYLTYIETEDKEELKNLINISQQKMDNAHSMAEAARALGYMENHPVIILAQSEWYIAYDYNKMYQSKYDEIIAEEKALEEELKALEEAEEPTYTVKAEAYEEYPAATTIWLYLKELGYNDYVCAGILGNLMAEVGGQTLNIQYWLSSSGYFGMCQWSRSYSGVWGADLETQCDYLRDTIKYELDTYGYAYQRGFNYDSFLSLTDEQAAAKAFAKCYERCASGSYSTRQKNATIAYNYFVN